jgi:PmbA protein
MLARGQSNSVSVRHGKVESSERSEDFDIGLRVFVGQQTASISTSQLDSNNIKDIAARAVAMAKLAPEDPFVRLASTEQLAKQIPQLEIFDPSVPDADTLRQRAIEAEASALAFDGITNSDGGNAGHGVVDVFIATTNGFSAGYQRSSHGVSAVVIAERNGQMERDYDYSSAVFEADLNTPKHVGSTAAKRTLDRLGAAKAKTGKFPVVYDRRVASSLVSTLSGAINGAAIARGTSFLKDCLGKKIAANNLNFIDDPTRPRGMASRPFDAEGCPVQTRKMVEDGVLTGWFLDLASAAKLGLDSMGNAKRSLGSAPNPGSSNFYLENGIVERQKLIAEIDEGFLITELMGSSVDMITGDYSRGAGGFWISKGEITHPISEATIAGNLKHMLMAITCASDIDLRDSTASPSLRIDGMTVAGT